MPQEITAEINPRYRKSIKRLEELIARGEELAASDKLQTQTSHQDAFLGGVRTTSKTTFRDDSDKQVYRQWQINCLNILTQVFGEESTHYRWYVGTQQEGLSDIKIRNLVAVLAAALEDLRGGYLIGQEFLVAGAMFDDVLQEAKHLQQVGHKDAAAVLGRIVLEDALRRLARSIELDDTGKVSGVNDRLKGAGLLTQPRWRGVQKMLDIGNAAAHGKFDQYSDGEVARMLDNIEDFLAAEFIA